MSSPKWRGDHRRPQVMANNRRISATNPTIRRQRYFDAQVAAFGDVKPYFTPSTRSFDAYPIFPSSNPFRFSSRYYHHAIPSRRIRILAERGCHIDIIYAVFDASDLWPRCLLRCPSREAKPMAPRRDSRSSPDIEPLGSIAIYIMIIRYLHRPPQAWRCHASMPALASSSDVFRR